MQPVIGMIVPPAAGEVPPEAYGLFPDGVRFVARGLALRELTVEAYASVIDRVGQLARELRDEEGATAVSLMGTSLSFFKGSSFNDELIKVMHEATGLPVTTMSCAIRDALRMVGAKRLALGTAYADEVNERLRVFLEESGFEVVTLRSLGLTDVQDIQAVTEAEVCDLGLRAVEQAAGRADALLVSCGGLPALNLAPTLEKQTGVPTIASASAGVWASVRLVGMDGDAPALGYLAEASRANPQRSPKMKA